MKKTKINNVSVNANFHILSLAVLGSLCGKMGNHFLKQHLHYLAKAVRIE